MKKIIRKPTEINALQWTGENHREMAEFLGANPNDYLSASGDNFYINHGRVSGGLIIKSLDGDIPAKINDYIVKENEKFQPYNPSDFESIFLNFEDNSNDADVQKIVAAQQYALEESKKNGIGQLTRIKAAWEDGFTTSQNHQSLILQNILKYNNNTLKNIKAGLSYADRDFALHQPILSESIENQIKYNLVVLKEYENRK
jgi:hypothetical protein